MEIQVQGEDNLYRDTSSGAIINNDKKAWESVKAARLRADRRDREIVELRAEIEVLKSLIRAKM
tara:strand:- start:1853 stop:2044 length:192 start_codon:yes stop_codon:yes gene_type:complete